MGRILFSNATLLDSEHRAQPGYSVLVTGGQIAAVEQGAIEAPDIDQSIDLKGKILMPGLIDAHLHLGVPPMNFAEMTYYLDSYFSIHAAKMAALMLQQGFTTVRDAGGVDSGLIQAIDTGLINGPRIFSAHSMITKTGGHGDTRYQHAPVDTCACHFIGVGTLVADGVDGVRKATRELLRRGATQIKIATSGGVVTERSSIHASAFSSEEIRAMVAEANDAETYVMAHAHGRDGIRRAIENGVRTIEHCSFLNEALAELMVKHQAYMSPTLFMAEALLADKELPLVIHEKMAAALEAMFVALKFAYAKGVKVGFGSDAFGPPLPRHAEEFLIRARDEDPYQVILAATAVNAAMLQQQDKLGVIKKHAYADLIVVDGNPLQEISLLADVQGRPIKLVMKAGKIYKNNLA